ncbi:MAG TPA: GNAT family N-acetyltransferase [Planctomycetaceae bacterium]|nr:GNAT family N-acetyltransferase [Planctomycetaceae bacterium]
MSSAAALLRVLTAERPEDRALWLRAWGEWPAREVFAHPDYVELFVRPGWQACCAYLDSGQGKVLYPFLLRDLAAEAYWSPAIGPATDIATPYGYGGAWFWSASSPETLAEVFWERFDRWAEENGVVSEFVRLSLFAERVLPYPGNVLRDRENVIRDLRPPESELWMDFKHKVRKNVNKAQRSGVDVEVDRTGASVGDFLGIYQHTMRRRQAGQMYHFDQEFFNRIHQQLGGQFAYFHAVHEGRVVSTELVLISADSVYSFLGGTAEAAFPYRPNDLIKYEIIRWAKAQGKHWFVLGGGYQPDDGIFRYKAAFAPGGIVPFQVGTRLLRPDVYEELCAARRRMARQQQRRWEPALGFFPAYRAETSEAETDEPTRAQRPSVEETNKRPSFAAWPVFGQDEIDAVAEVLRSGQVSCWTGERVRRFEEEFAAHVDCPHAVAVTNGTVALELALYALGIQPGDEVIVPARSFVASAACCVVRGAVPVFADVDPTSQTVTAETIRPLLGPRARAIIVVHLAGWPCEMDPIMELAEEYRLAVIEDCAQAHGARYKGRPVGSLGHVAAFSFCQDKILTTGGEGGMLTTRDRDVWRRAWSYKDHGKDWQTVRRSNPDGLFRWVHHQIGTNARMTEMQAAIGRVQLRKLDEWLRSRRQHAALLDAELSRFHALRVSRPPAHVEHSYYKYYTFIRPERLKPGWNRDRIVSALAARGIPCGTGICPEIYREAAFVERNLAPPSRLPVAHRLGQTSLMLPVHPTLSQEEILRMAKALGEVLEVACLDPAAMRHAA